MKSDNYSDSDSDGSHISATPPGTPKTESEPILFPSSVSGNRTQPKPNPLFSNNLTTEPAGEHPSINSTGKPKPERKLEPVPFIFSGLTDTHGLAGKIRPASPDSNRNRTKPTSFSAVFRSRQPTLNPFDIFCTSEVIAESEIFTSSISKSNSVKEKGKRDFCVNWVGSTVRVPVQEQQSKKLKRGSEGNFVRLNINGYTRKSFKFVNGKGKKKRFHSWSRRRKEEKSFGVPEPGTTGLVEEEGGVAAGDGVVKKWKDAGKCDVEMVEEAVAAVREDLSEDNLKKLLKLTHGYDSFRAGQMEAIRKVIAGESTMLVLPTGAGKSLCYQLPSLVLPGITLVISPLLALMVDQLSQLPSVIPGGLLSSSQTMEEVSATLDMLRERKIKVLFVSPERLLNSKFLSVLEDTSPISLVAVDEAHCVSEWSHNFRPSYLRLRASFLRSKLNVNCRLAMTATATNQTLQDIISGLEIPHTNLIQIRQIRKNLQLHITFSENRLKDLLMLMRTSPLVDMKSIIIYCKFQAETDMISKYLRDNNILAKGYHSGVSAKDRNRIQELFCLNKIRVVVATVSFGMGLNKTDVERYAQRLCNNFIPVIVIHYSLPESLEEYIQETGRAGRDGRLSYCHLLLDYMTFYKIRSLSYSDGIDEYAINKLLSHIFTNDVPIGQVCSLIKESATRKFDIKEEVLLTILTQLEVGDVQHLQTSPSLLSEKHALVAAILKNSDMIKGSYVFDVPTMANTTGITAADFLNQLLNLKLAGEISYDLKDPAFCFVVLKKPDDFCSLTRYLTNWLSNAENCKVKKLDAMFSLASFAVKECKKVSGCSHSMHTACIQKNIADYYSDDFKMNSNDFLMEMRQSSPFLRADIKVFLQSNSHAKFTPRAVARIMHGIPSPAFPAATWSKSHFWGRYIKVDFPVVMQAATLELMNSVRKVEY